MTPTKRDTSKKRESILDGAQQVFLDVGYDNASMDRIAEIAGASKRTVYNHFASKEELFKAVQYRILMASFALKQVMYDPKLPLREQLDKFADAKMEFIRNPVWLGMLKVTTSVFINYPDLVREIIMQIEDHENTLAVWLKEADKDGRLKVLDPELATQVFWTMMGGAFLLPGIIYGSMDLEEASIMKQELIETFLARYKV